jgi:hypothetical protein
MSSVTTRSSSRLAREQRLAIFSRESLIAGTATAGIAVHVYLRWLTGAPLSVRQLPLYVVLAAGGTPLVVDLAVKA